MITYRPVTEPSEFVDVAKLEQLVWGVSDFDALSANMLTVITHTGGCVHGAFDGDKMIGCSVATPMKNEPRLWSHIAAVHPDYQRKGIGFTLKQVQREWAKNNGYTCMSWTFDPMMASNAHFNFHMLGVYCKTYHVNFYGEMNDDLNRGVPSDRFEIIWPFDETSAENPPESASFLLTRKDEKPVIENSPSAEWHFVEIPPNFFEIRQNNKALAIEWKLALRDVSLTALEAGYHVVDFMRENGHNWYVLKRENT